MKDKVYVHSIIDNKVLGIVVKNGESFPFDMALQNDNGGLRTFDELEQVILQSVNNKPLKPPEMTADRTNLVENLKSVNFEDIMRKMLGENGYEMPESFKKTQKQEEKFIKSDDFSESYERKLGGSSEYRQLMILAETNPRVVLMEVLDILNEAGLLGDDE